MTTHPSPTGDPADGPAPATARVGARPAPDRSWLVVFFVGLALWGLTVLVTFATGNANLLPTLVLLGSFLVPVTFVAWAYDRLGPSTALTPRRILAAFMVGGTLGVLGASVLESYFLHPSVWMYVGVGLIEEGVKLAALWLMALHLTHYTRRDGMVLGAAVGFGFAALESSGYALTALVTVKGLSLTSLVQTEVLRGLLAPFGHGLWTAIIGAVLFSTAARGGRPRLTGGLVGAFLGVSVLHALWDSMHGIAIAVALNLTGTAWQWRLIDTGYLPQPSQAQVNLILALQVVGWIVVSAVAVLWLRALAGRPQPAPVPGAAHAAPSRR
ncbi:PrsW family intramembrane metalloprotease [Kitasatospora sp. NPDC057015]|uniref:PrsW family intramembrane metalloprotease n=1 Tax=Kitasatospora sp. NPDC057015 TaxID=3346001 RepID=UPI0036368A55